MPENWRASVSVTGSPGADDTVSLHEWLVINGMAEGEESSDLDQDGIPALIEYTTGADPNSFNANAVDVTLIGRAFEFSSKKSRAASGVDIVLEYSTDLNLWAPGVPIGTIDLGGGIDRIVSRPINPTAGRQFARLRVTTAP
ncbi:MAG: hypothetical protein ACJAVK_001524 [Akkermansiaceae bacterium]